VAKLLYKPVGILVGVLAGLVATQIFEKIWGLFSETEPADPDDREAGWAEVVIAATVSGAIFGAVRAAIQRGGAKGFERATGIWPGDQSKTKS
jgi:hypothetical protein